MRLDVRTIDRATLRQIGLYLAIGGLVFCVDVFTLQAMIARGIMAALAATLSFALGVSTHFLLNRYLNFRNFERAIHAQARTYVVIVTFSWLVTIAIIEAGVRLGLGPLQGKMIAVVVNLPVGYLAHRYMTFSKGMRAAFRARNAARATEIVHREEAIR